MAAIDKMYGNISQYYEFYNWCAENKPTACKYFCVPNEDSLTNFAMTNFPQDIDSWLIENCPIRWVQSILQEQYGSEDYSHHNLKWVGED